jgi:hypothetical protein
MQAQLRREAVKQLKVEAKERQAWEPCENYRKLVCQEAWRAWRRLPAHTKSWIQVEDMINHGMWLVYRYINKVTLSKAGLPIAFDGIRSKKISTGLQHVLHNVFIFDYIATYGAWKRGWEKSKDGKLVPLYMNSLEGMQEKEHETGANAIAVIPDLVTSSDSIINNTLTKCYVIPAVEQVYHQASLELKQEIVQWFWYKSTKVHTKGKPFQERAKEFRFLADKQKLTCNDCLHLVRSPDCLDTLSRNLFQIPYDHNCTPVFN